ncbi:MAG: substrate-binding domain-containing protein [Anaerolineae bacterium]
MIRRSIYILILLMVMAAAACTAQPTPTVAPTATTPAVTLSVSGSGSVTPVLAAIADEFHAANPGIVLEVLPGSDTGDAVRGTVEGVLDFAAMSRAAKDEEVAQGIVYVPFGGSVTAIYTHADVGVSALTGEQLTGIFTGTITNWSEVGGEDLSIVVYIRDPEESNTVDIRETFIGDAAFAEVAQLMNSQSDMQDAVAGVPGAIGYGTWATAVARAAQVVSLTVDGLGVDNAPETMQTVMGMGYMGNNVEAIQPLIDWLLSAEGQAALAAVGVVPLEAQ